MLKMNHLIYVGTKVVSEKFDICKKTHKATKMPNQDRRWLEHQIKNLDWGAKLIKM